MSRKQPKRRAGRLAQVTIAGLFVLVAASGVGFGVATADSSDDLARAGAFGFDEETHAATQAVVVNDTPHNFSDAVMDQQSLATSSSRDISAGLAMIDQVEADERERVEAENRAAIKRAQDSKAKQGVYSNANGAPAAGATEYGLPAVDWSCGHDAFVEEWGTRIDDYLSGSQLAGYGSVFAEAAWNNGVDPRWSPAISNTESGKGSSCFLSHNAWGWGSTGWSDWSTAINAHVEGLAKGYGYSITPDAAAVYCPPNHAFWYSNTLSQMSLI